MLRSKQPVTGLLAEFSRLSDFGACMIPLLMSLGYRGDLRHIAEALPHFSETLDLTGLRNMMANMTFVSRPARINFNAIDQRLMPCLFVPDHLPAMVLLKRKRDGLIIFNGGTAQVERTQNQSIPGTAYFFGAMDQEERTLIQKRLGWFRMVAERFQRLIVYILLITFAVTLLQVAAPLFTMAVYDRVVGNRSMETLTNLLFGISLVMVFDWFLRKLRSKMLMYVGSRMDSIVSNAVFMRILSLTPSYTERAPTGAQVARIKDFDAVREFFTGPLMMVFFELPFSVVFFVVIAILGGPLALVPMVTMLLFVALWMVMMPMVAKEETRSRRAGSKKQEFVVEALGRMRALKYGGMESIWLERFRVLSAQSAMANFRTALINALVSSISSILIVGSGVTVIGLGVYRVMDHSMTTGGLVAAMVLVWRVLAPIQSAFIAMTRLEQVRSSVTQINSLMNVTPEREEYAAIEPIKTFKGHISFVRVSIRYVPEAEPALMGVTFDVNPGQVIAVIGPNGSGKSTIVKLIAGLYTPQAGSIRIDGLDIRQMNVIELRHAVAYVPQSCNLFYGTIAQNLRLSHATASDEDLEEACRKAQVYDEIMALPKQFWTRVGDQKSAQLPSSMVQKLSLARAYLKPSKIMLFDEPASSLGWEDDQAFIHVVEQLRGKRTIFIVTHRPSHIRLADVVLYMDQGYLRLSGPPNDVLRQIPGGFV
ncbi:MAG: ATP-binding cassette domain-containing protein [Magnetococcales bacterium]|nr:ATP-binding cassette domain-containing protein [Magnetococcales bacterium]MBF0439314.1 ATP-binding cassette domain-containing protein [Magnetococcales bacterium]